MNLYTKERMNCGNDVIEFQPFMGAQKLELHITQNFTCIVSRKLQSKSFGACPHTQNLTCLTLLQYEITYTRIPSIATHQ
eukprot:c26854_g2_i3 orf=406-645(+)